VGRRLDFLTQEFMREANTLFEVGAQRLDRDRLDLKPTIEHSANRCRMWSRPS
jgi:uncharacterized protein YicC (UPF0701 family)